MSQFLRGCLPLRIIPGALLRHDGHAVALISGGAPATDLRDDHAVGQLGAQYHRLLCALDVPVSVYQCDVPPQLAAEIHQIQARQAATPDRALRQILGAVAENLLLAAQQPAAVKQTVWAVTIAPVRTERQLPTRLLRRPPQPASPGDHRDTGAATLAQAVQVARRFAAQLAALDGTPAPGPMAASAIALLCYQQLDPVRAARYPLTGTLLQRLERSIDPHATVYSGASDDFA